MSSPNAHSSCGPAESSRHDQVVVKDPVPLRDAVAAVGRQLGMPPVDVVSTLEQQWIDIVGATIAEHAQVRSVRDGECTIAVDGPAWATQIRYASSDLVARVNERCGEGSVTSIRVVVTGPRTTR
jgi:predicted nucleic acid-binding Zn ribbon protein